MQSAVEPKGSRTDGRYDDERTINNERTHGAPIHWLGAYRTNALYSGHIFVRFNDLDDVFT